MTLPATDTPAVELRSLTRADLPRVLEIEQASFTSPWRAETFESLLARSDTDLVGAVSQGRLLGYCICWTIADQSELGNLAVDAAARGSGLGQRLVQEALERVRRRGARECFLEVRHSNEQARALYEKHGFAVIGKRRRYYRHPVEDALVMRAELY